MYLLGGLLILISLGLRGVLLASLAVAKDSTSVSASTVNAKITVEFNMTIGL